MAPQDRVERRVVRVSEERTWTPAQILALVLGLAYVVLGGVALLRTLGGSEWVAEVAGMAYTPVLGSAEIVFGLVLMATGAQARVAERAVFLGVLALALGLILVIEPDALSRWIAAGRSHGWLYVITGGILALTGLVGPWMRERLAERRAGEEEVREPTGTTSGERRTYGTQTQRIETGDDRTQSIDRGEERSRR